MGRIPLDSIGRSGRTRDHLSRRGAFHLAEIGISAPVQELTTYREHRTARDPHRGVEGLEVGQVRQIRRHAVPVGVDDHQPATGPHTRTSSASATLGSGSHCSVRSDRAARRTRPRTAARRRPQRKLGCDSGEAARSRATVSITSLASGPAVARRAPAAETSAIPASAGPQPTSSSVSPSRSRAGRVPRPATAARLPTPWWRPSRRPSSAPGNWRPPGRSRSADRCSARWRHATQAATTELSVPWAKMLV